MKYIPGLNALRALAVSFVIADHWGLPFHILSGLPSGTLGSFGVDIFFVLSGFLITSILLIEKEKYDADPKQSTKIIVNFYIRRFLRIFPLYYLSLLVLYLVHYPDLATRLPYYITYTENFDLFIDRAWNTYGHTWSLSVEEQFYLIWPFIMIFSKRKYLLPVLVFFILIGPAFSVFQFKVLQAGPPYVLTPSCFDAFGIGGLLAYFYIHDKICGIKKYVKIMLPLAMVLFIYWIYAGFAGHFLWLGRMVHSIMGVSLILLCFSQSWPKIKKYVLENKILNQLGIVSYGIYLFHFPLPYFYWQVKHWLLYGAFDQKLYQPKAVMDILTGGHNARSFPDYLIQIMIVLGLSFLSYYLMEKPILRLKNRFAY